VADRSFASDNYAGVHPAVIEVLSQVNAGHVTAYGADAYTTEAVAVLRRHLGDQAQVFFVFTGTAANVLCINAVARSYHGVVCADSAHINVDECGAPEKYTGCKLLPVATSDGKLRPEDVAPLMEVVGFEHAVQPKVISISQTTEVGTVYQPGEIAGLADFAHERGMYLHLDGARISNAAAALGVGLSEITTDVGVDMMSFGGTKNGLMAAEAVIFLDPSLAEDFLYIRKQGMQLGSKMRFVAAQFTALFTGDLWLDNARHANTMAARLASGLAGVDGIEIVHPVEANAVFAKLPKESIEELQREFPFYVWQDDEGIVRLMASWDTTEEDVDRFVDLASG